MRMFQRTIENATMHCGSASWTMNCPYSDFLGTRRSQSMFRVPVNRDWQMFLSGAEVSRGFSRSRRWSNDQNGPGVRTACSWKPRS